MEDEIQKRNTDCVYFLASPLTCKKGVECEYRHSEVARLNPRDCYYWLAGNCLNPTCAFRHPPLDGRSETSTEPAALPQQPTLPVNKVLVPCYFYFNGFCNKGDKCSFLHGPNDVSSTPKVLKTTPIVNDVYPSENKTSTGSDTLTVVVEAPSIPSKTSTSKSVVNVQVKPHEDVQQSLPSNGHERSPSLQTSVPDCEEEAVKSDTPLPAEDFIGQSLSPEQQSSEEQAEEEHIEREEWWESSPGLDVLVDNGSEGYEDDQEYLPVHDAEVRRLHEHLLQYDYEDPVGYDPMEYTGAGVPYEDGVYNIYNGLEDEDISDYCREVPKPSMDVNSDSMILQRRKVFPGKLELNGRNGIDLRDHLRKRKRIDGHQPYRNPRWRGPSFLEEKNQERPTRHHMGHPYRRRLASEVGLNVIGFESEKNRELNGVNRRNTLRQSEARRIKARQREKDKRRQFRPHHPPSKVSSKDPISSEMRGSQETTTTLFTGPKTLAQIREEKRKDRVNGEDFGKPRRRSSKVRTSEDFEGPKPLSEILKDKRRLGSVSDDGSTTRSKLEVNHRHVERERGNHDYFDRDRIGLMIDEEDDDEEGLEKKLASMYS